MPRRGFRRIPRNERKETTPYLWFPALLIVLASCVSTPDASAPGPPEAAPAQADAPGQADAPAQAGAETSAQASEHQPTETRTSSLEERNRNLAAQVASLSSNNQLLRSRLEALEGALSSLREENEVLHSLVDDILLAQGVLRPSAPSSAIPTQPGASGREEASEETRARESVAETPRPPAPVTRPRPLRPSVAAAPNTPEAADRRDEPEPQQTEPQPESRVPAPAGDAESDGPTSVPSAAPFTGFDASRAARASNLRMIADGGSGGVRYVDARIPFEAAAVSYLSIQASTGAPPTLHLHLRLSRERGYLRAQSGLLVSEDREFRLDESNSTTLRHGGAVEELVARVTPTLFATLRHAIRTGGTMRVEGLQETIEWELSAVERAAMTNTLYAFQDLGGTVPE